MKKYYTYDKNKNYVEVDQDVAKQLVSSGKKKPEEFDVEDIEDTPKTSDKISQNQTTQFQEEKKTIPEEAVEMIRSVGKSMIPPTSPESLLQSPIVNAPIALEKSGQSVKNAVQESLSNMARTPTQGIIPKSAILGALSTATEVAPFTPSGFGTAVAGEVLPLSIPKSVIDKIPKSIVNRFLRTPSGIAKSRLSGGKETTGEEFLKNKVLNPEGFAELPSGDKQTIYNTTVFQIKKLGNEVVNELEKYGLWKPTGKGAGLINKNELLERPEVVNTVLNEILPNIEKYGLQKNVISTLKKAINEDVWDFKTANRVREIIGDYVGKRFEKDEVPEAIDAMRGVFASLRNKIGQISPKIDKALRDQHVFYDIQNSVAPEVAKGFSRTSRGLWDMIASPMEESVKLASVLKNLPNQRGIGGLSIGKELFDYYKKKNTGK